ncbi:Hint domain-containing protein [Marivita hallyeonensis]|uniref:Hint domain-containing protein n=1 Tax=Marivita hallyeonensis TaxID=996342 RepID=A0A1M5XF79_9RHOB|nr:Hint domain-containing protein [Marivita hallyeonensis]SHH98451.1 Hint domain-containing protein [Marivita hallyeonensis]
MAPTPTIRSSEDDFNAYAVSGDNIATFDGQALRDTSLTRTIESAALLSNQSISEATYSVPAIPTFEACAAAFARGTLITTVMGPIAVEDLIPGDLVETHRGPEPVMWIGSTPYTPDFPGHDTSLTHLLRLPGHGFDQSDLLLGPAARLVIRQDRFNDLLNCDAVLAPASDYVDGDRILKITPPGSVQLYHFALRRHGIVKANGHELESYHPGRVTEAELGTSVRDMMQSMFRHLRELEGFGDLAFPRTTRDVIETLRVA